MHCYCSQCFPFTPTHHPRTVEKHLKADRGALAVCTNQDQRAHLQQRIDLTSGALRGEVNKECRDEPGQEANLESSANMDDVRDISGSGDPSNSSSEIIGQSGLIFSDADANNTMPMDIDNERYSGPFSDNSPIIDSVEFDSDGDQLQDELWWDNHSDSEAMDSKLGSDGESDLEDEFEDVPNAEQLVADLDQPFFTVPEIVQNLRDCLRAGYSLPDRPPTMPPYRYPLSNSEINSLKHYITWVETNGTVEAYRKHAANLESMANTTILPLYRVKKFAQQITDFSPREINMCPRGCLAYTGDHSHKMRCDYTQQGKPTCGERRYVRSASGELKPRAQVQILPVMATIRAMFANAETSALLRHRDHCLKEALHLVGSAAKRQYSDFGNSQIHILQNQNLGLFQDSRHVALALSSDGAQLTMKKQSNTWIMLLIILNLPASMRYKTRNTIISFATPGPNSPGDLESFLWPLFEEMAIGSEGLWIWDAMTSSYFANQCMIAMVLGDMLGSAKLNGMAGHTGLFGDRFSKVQGAKSSLQKGAKSQYYPMNPPQNERYNPDRRKSYNLEDIPMRKQSEYWRTIQALSEPGLSKKDKAAITRATGISRLPLCAASVAFTHPTFFPLDPFHLFYENCMAFIWDIWTVHSKVSESVHFPQEKVQELGRLIPLAMSTLPPSFCGPIRDPNLKCQSQYKVYEWMALLHWYILPIATELSINPTILKNFSRFVEAIEFAMTTKPRNEEEIQYLHKLIVRFLEDYEEIYIGQDPEKINRARLCIFQLIHVPIHIQWNGSIRLGSQATVERSIGEMGHKIRSKKAPFANLTNIIYQRELVKILRLHYPAEFSSSKTAGETDLQAIPAESRLRLVQRHNIAWTKLHENHELVNELIAVAQYLGINAQTLVDLKEDITGRFGKAKLKDGNTLRSQLSRKKSQSQTIRRSEWFEAAATSASRTEFNLIFGEARAFYQLGTRFNSRQLAVYTPLQDVRKTFHIPTGKWNPDSPMVLEVSAIQSLVGIWVGILSKRVYMLRKHPGLQLLTREECGLQSDNIEEDEDEYD